MIDPAQLLANPQVSSSSDPQQGQALDRDAFMRLLVSQLENQDPLDPMDAREMVTQLSQLTSVEYLMGIEDRIGSLELSTVGLSNSSVASLVGKEVQVDAARLTLDVQGSAEASYQLPAQAAEVTVTVRNSAGQTVKTLSFGPRGPGRHQVTWDGTDDAGSRLGQGVYRISVSAANAEGQPVAASTLLRGTVDGVHYDRGFPELQVGSARVLLGDVQSVSGAPAPFGPAASTEAGTSPLANGDSENATGNQNDEEGATE